jgi:hypothetical protein
MLTQTRKWLVAGFLSASLVGGMAAPAAAQVTQDGLVNVGINVGDVTVTIEDVNVGIAALVAANVCGLKIGPIAVLGTAVDASGDTTTVCTQDDFNVTLEQN